MKTIFDSIHDQFTANIFADYFEEQDKSKIARLLLTPPLGQDTSLKHDDGCGTGSYGDSSYGSYGDSSYGSYGDGSYGDATFEDGYGDGGYCAADSGYSDGGNPFQAYQQTLHSQQNPL
jgi:hypothetical protein